MRVAVPGDVSRPLQPRQVNRGLDVAGEAGEPVPVPSAAEAAGCVDEPDAPVSRRCVVYTSPAIPAPSERTLTCWPSTRLGGRWASSLSWSTQGSSARLRSRALGHASNSSYFWARNDSSAVGSALFELSSSGVAAIFSQNKIDQILVTCILDE